MSREGRARWGVNSRFLIGKQDNPMMERWRLIQTPWFGLYVHFIYREDLDPIPHDHPWNFVRIVLRGGYREKYTEQPGRLGALRLRFQYPFRPSYVPTRHAHHITHVLPGTVSLVIVGRKHRTWGFWKPYVDEHGIEGVSATWVDYRDALYLRPTEGSRSQHWRTGDTGATT